VAIRRRRKPQPRKEDIRYKYRVNEEITAPEVRLAGDNVAAGIYPIEEALELARMQGLDLVEVAPKADPPVCRILEFGKFIYEKKKREKEQKAKAGKQEMKEIRFGPYTDEHDFQFKLRHGREFLEQGNKLKVYVMFRGRSILHKDKGRDILQAFWEQVEDMAKMEQPPKLEGRRMIMLLTPVKKKKKKKDASQQAENESGRGEAV